MAARVLRLSTRFRRRVEDLGVLTGSPAYHAVSAAMRALAVADLPGPMGFETRFSPGRAFVRRVTGQNLWILYRFSDDHLFIMTTRGHPPVPVDA